ncbi:hypothetical protein FRB99_007060, partial [Tulasnella sp. 403]
MTSIVDEFCAALLACPDEDVPSEKSYSAVGRTEFHHTSAGGTNWTLEFLWQTRAAD